MSVAVRPVLDIPAVALRTTAGLSSADDPERPRQEPVRQLIADDLRALASQLAEALARDGLTLKGEFGGCPACMVLALHECFGA